MSPIPESLNLDKLKNYQCEVHCLDSFIQRYDEGYRASMKHDQNMANVVAAINEMSGEIQACYC